MGKRTLNNELLDIWATIVGEKIDKAVKKQEDYEVCSLKYQRLAGLTDGLAQSLTILSMLENGRLQKDYDRILASIKDEYESNVSTSHDEIEDVELD